MLVYWYAYLFHSIRAGNVANLYISSLYCRQYHPYIPAAANPGWVANAELICWDAADRCRAAVQFSAAAAADEAAAAAAAELAAAAAADAPGDIVAAVDEGG